MLISAALVTVSLLTQPADSVREMVAHRLDAAAGEPVLDGRLEEPAWGQAAAAGGFVQLRPRPGGPASQRTEARILYGDDAVYVGMRMYDTAPDSIAAQLGRRDDSGIFSDWAHVAFDSYNDNRTAFRFSVNPRGVKLDAFHYDDGNDDSGWDAVWDVATAVDSLGWTAEFRIPLSQLRYASRGGELVWGVNFGREIARLGEESFWSPVPANSNRVVSSFGELRGLRGLASPRRLELQPYTVARVARAPGDAADPFHRPTDAAAAVGGDLRYGITSDFTLTATLNPDFGQVESDPAVVNLSAYETFLPERRPFFVEGMDIFRFGIGAGDGDFGNEQLFYSRRIGRTPQHHVDTGGGYQDAPTATTILGAAKLSGRTRNGWSLGALHAVTAEERARYVVGDEAQVREQVAEPLTNYSVLRAVRDFDQGRTAVGGVATATHRRLLDHLDYLPSSAYAGGVNLRHRFGGGSHELRSWVLGSWVQGDSAAIDRLQRAPTRRFQRPDATHLDYDPGRTSLGGWAASAELLKTGGGHWSYGGIVNVRSPEFEVNDLGYQRDADTGLQALFVGYQQFEPGPLLRNWRIGLNEWTGWNFAGDRVSTGGNVNGGLQLKNFWGAYGGVNYEAEALSTGALRGGPAIVRPASFNSWFGVYSDPRRPVQLDVDGGVWRDAVTDDLSWRVGTEVELRPSSRLELAVQPSYSRNINSWQWVGAQSLDGGAHYLFGRMEQQTAALTARLNYTFSADLSLQLYAQPFVSAGRFSDFRYAADPRADDFGRRLPRFAGALSDLSYDAAAQRYRADLDGDGAADAALGNPDFNVKQFRSNAVLRWEYLPGSTLFVVWSQGREDFLNDGSFRLGRDAGRLFGTADEFGVPATNVLLVKLSYWLNL